MLNQREYFNQFTYSPERSNKKYYGEMQQLAYNLVKYLLNATVDDNPYQNNHNLTYLIENMNKSDFYNLTNKFMRRIPIDELHKILKNWKNDFISKLDAEHYLDYMEYEEKARKYDLIKSALFTINDAMDDDD